MRASLLFVLLAGCSNASVASSLASAGTSGEPVGITREAIGEQENGFPSPWERATFMAANRARSDPSTVKGAASTVYPAVKPLVLEYELEQSSRFHSINLDDAGVTLMHTSPCTLNTDVATSGCTGVGSCACATPVPATCEGCNSDAGAINTCGTAPFTRIHYFYPPANAEVAAAGYTDPWSLMDGWVDEPTGDDGHREIIDSVNVTGTTIMPADYSVAGFGHAGGDGPCFRGLFDVGDFGPTTTAPPAIASAAPMPISSTAAATFIVYATWSDPGGAPADLNAVVDTTCYPMTRELGTDTLNATYMASVPLPVGCHSVFIVGDSTSKVRTIYPTTTAFTIPVGAGVCAAEVAQPVVECPGVDGGVGGADAGIKSDAGDAGEKQTGGDDGGGNEGGLGLGVEGGTAGGPEAGSVGAGLDATVITDSGNDTTPPSSTGGCACSVATPTRATGVWSALAAACLVLPLRRRRRARAR
jgi:hypothetical protein